jgi:DNA-binding transcriptional ArsR family regulator
MNNDSVFKALADQNRRKIIRLLRKHNEMTAGEISKKFNISKPAISEHLKILKNAGLLFSVKKGQFVEYSLNSSIFEELLEFFIAFLQDKKEGDSDG